MPTATRTNLAAAVELVEALTACQRAALRLGMTDFVDAEQVAAAAHTLADLAVDELHDVYGACTEGDTNLSALAGRVITAVAAAGLDPMAVL